MKKSLTYMVLPGQMQMLILVLALELMASVASAQYFTGPIASALGGAGRAAVDPSESSFLNPASLVHLGRYFGSVNYFRGDDPRDGSAEQFGVILADGGPDKIAPGALSYLRRNLRSTVGEKVLEEDIRLSLGGFIVESLSFGVAGRYLIHNRVGGPDYYQTNGDVGLLYVPIPNLGFGLVAYDILFPSQEKVPTDVRLAPSVAFGVHYLFDDFFRVRLDIARPEKLNSQHRNNVMTGIETFFSERWAYRLGAHWQETEDKTFLTTGFGFKGPRLSFDYAFAVDTRVAHATRHMFDLWMPF